MNEFNYERKLQDYEHRISELRLALRFVADLAVEGGEPLMMLMRIRQQALAALIREKEADNGR